MPTTRKSKPKFDPRQLLIFAGLAAIIGVFVILISHAGGNVAPPAKQYGYNTLISSTSVGSVYACQLPASVPVEGSTAGWYDTGSVATIYMKVTTAKVPKTSPPSVQTSFDGNATTITNLALKPGLVTNYLSVPIVYSSGSNTAPTTFNANVFSYGTGGIGSGVAISSINSCYAIYTKVGAKAVLSQSSLGTVWGCKTIMSGDQASVMTETTVKSSSPVYLSAEFSNGGTLVTLNSGTKFQTVTAAVSTSTTGSWLPVANLSVGAYLSPAPFNSTVPTAAPSSMVLLSNMPNCTLQFIIPTGK